MDSSAKEYPFPTTKIRILLVDDHELVRKGLRVVLEANPNYKVCGEASNGQEAIEKANLLKPDVVVMDISMPGLNGLEAARRIKKELAQTEVLVLTINESEQLAQQLLNAGVRGYILKSDATRDLIAGIESLQKHRPFFTPKITKMILEGYLNVLGGDQPPTAPPALLTPRERQVVQLLAEGKSSKEVAEALDITLKTSETHRANIMRKLDLHSISDLVRYAIRNQIIEP